MAVEKRSWGATHLAFQKDTLKLGSASGFWYDQFTVKSSVSSSDYPHQLQLYQVPSGRLQVRAFEGSFESRELYLSYETRMLGSSQYLLLLRSSVITYSLCLSTNTSTSSSSAEFFVFDSLSKFSNFIDEYTDGSDAVSRHVLRIGTIDEPVCSEVVFRAEKDAYYFLTGQCPGDVNYQYNITSLIKYINYTDYEDHYVCTVGEDHNCEVELGGRDNVFGSAGDMDLLGYVVPLPPYIVVSPTTHVKVTALKRYTVLVTPSLVIVIGILLLFVAITVHLYVILKRRRHQRYGYVAIQSYG